MKTKHIILLILTIVFYNSYLYAQNITPHNAYTMAVDFFEFKTNDTIPVANKSYNITPVAENDTVFLYVVEIEGVGWTLISSHMLAGPFFAYSTDSEIDLNNSPPSFDMWIELYKSTVRYCMDNPTDSSFYQN